MKKIAKKTLEKCSDIKKNRENYDLISNQLDRINSFCKPYFSDSYPLS